MTTPRGLGRGEGHPETNLTPLTPPSGTAAWATSPPPPCPLSLPIRCPLFGRVSCQFCTSRDPKLTLEQGQKALSATSLREMLLFSEHIFICCAVQLTSSYVCQSVLLDRDRNLKKHTGNLQQSLLRTQGPQTISNLLNLQQAERSTWFG